MLMFNVLFNAGLIARLRKTVNAPKGYSVEQVEKVYERLYRGGAKGGTVYVDGSRDSQVLTLKAEENNLDETMSIRKKNQSPCCFS